MQLVPVNTWKDVPVFSSLAEEAVYWESHELAPRLMESSLLNPDNRESTTITLRFDPRMLSRIKRIARSHYLNYQSMMKQWLAERLAEEALRNGQDDSTSSADE